MCKIGAQNKKASKSILDTRCNSAMKVAADRPKGGVLTGEAPRWLGVLLEQDNMLESWIPSAVGAL